MILSKIRVNQKTGVPIGYQVIDYECDECKSQISGTYYNRDKKFVKYNKDLCRSCIQKYYYSIGQRKSHFSEYNKSCIGQTFEERFGEERAKKIKKKKSLVVSGENNPNFGGCYCRGWADNPLHGSFEERYGKEKSDIMKLNISKRVSGEGNPMFGKPSPIGSGNGWQGWYKNNYFSSLLELSFMIKMEQENKTIETLSGKNNYKINYNFNGVQRTYFPDFLVDNKIIEIKPKRLCNTQQNIKKFEAAKEKYGDNFQVITEFEFDKINFDEIILLEESGELKFIPRYEEKLNVYRTKIYSSNL